MTVTSVFDFRFPAESTEEGVRVARSIGEDMPATAGYLGHEVIRDFTDAGHVLVITRWSQRAEAEAVLGTYIHNPKVERASTLIGSAPEGFLGAID